MTRNAVPPLDLRQALRRCAAGERAALREIYDQEAARMLGVAGRILRRPALAEEAVHDAFLRVWQRAGSYDPARGEPVSWLYAILRHTALNILRGETRTDLVADLEPFGLTDPDEGPEAVVLRLSEAGRLRRCLDLLEPPRRAAIVLAYSRGMSHGELANHLGVPLGTVKSWIRRSLGSLKACMQ